MKHRIQANTDKSVDIDISVDKNQKNTVLKGLQQCQSGSCGCPTDQYDKLKRIDLDASGGDIKIHLEAKGDGAIDTDAVEECLQWMEGQAKSAQD